MSDVPHPRWTEKTEEPLGRGERVPGGICNGTGSRSPIFTRTWAIPLLPLEANGGRVRPTEVRRGEHVQADKENVSSPRRPGAARIPT